VQISIELLNSFQVPCKLTKCHNRASICVNRFFHAQCLCDRGYAGNGKDYCDGKQNSIEKRNAFAV
jgi:hypothetical protein